MPVSQWGAVAAAQKKEGSACRHFVLSHNMSDLPPPLPTPSTDDASSITSAPVQPTLPGQTIWGMTIDVSGLQNRIFQLERELQFEKREKESMRAKYVLDLEEREKKHRKKIKEMEGEVEMLKKQLADSNRAISELRSEMHKEIAINKRQRARLLCGSVAYVYIESAGTFLLLPSSLAIA